MSRMYDVNDAKDIKALNQVLNNLGVHFERNIFDHPYVILDHTVFKMVKLARKNASRKQCSKRESTRIPSASTV